MCGGVSVSKSEKKIPGGEDAVSHGFKGGRKTGDAASVSVYLKIMQRKRNRIRMAWLGWTFVVVHHVLPTPNPDDHNPISESSWKANGTLQDPLIGLVPEYERDELLIIGRFSISGSLLVIELF